MSKKIDIKLLAKMYLAFFKIGAFTFGGGLAMLPMMEKELIEKNHWTTQDELFDYYAISQITPGIIAVNVATYIGYNLAGILGGILTTLGVVTPSIIIITAIAYFIDSFSEIYWVQSALAGINVAVASLMTVTAVKFIKQGLKSCNIIVALILMISSFVLISFFNVPSSICIIFGSIIGIVIHVISVHHQKKIETPDEVDKKDEANKK